ncbi:MAG: SRPBCC domain-containing protein [Promethearchaeota archaeon]
MKKSKVIKKEVIIKAAPHDVYEAFMDSKTHSKFTESKAKISREVGGDFSVFEGTINGKNLELVPDKKIVQTWRSEDENWSKGFYSTITIIFEAVEEGTLIKFTHVDVPESAYDSVKDGWTTYYWKPLKKLLEK